jgi:uncharacterized membrane protein
MRRLILLAALGLAACGKAEAPTPPAPPADAAIDVRRPMDASGLDPAWALKIRGPQFTLDRPGEPQIVATAPGAVIQPGKASWTAVTGDGRSLKVNLYSSACSDGASEVRYSYSAEVILPDGSLLAGCAALAAPKARAQVQARVQAKR